MEAAHFSRVLDDTSWKGLLDATQKQRKNNCIPLNYEVVNRISLSISDFDTLTEKIISPHSSYLKYTRQSIPSTHGTWKCIVISNDHDSRQVALYTAGRTFPLYAAIV